MESSSFPPSALPLSYQTLSPRRIALVIFGLVLSLLLAALDQTIVGTAMPRVIADLQGFEQYAWVTTAYMLSSTAVVPIVGKLSDMYGSKGFLLGGAAFFLLASMLCGIAQDMTQLVVFRGLQGIGAGILMAVTFTVISALFPPAKRGRIQGAFGAVFGLASVVGPLLGGYLTDNLSWRWVFYVNLPVGALALAVLWFTFPNIRPERKDRSIDYLGAATLVAAVVPLLLALSWGGRDYAWTSPLILGLIAFGLGMTATFLFVETRAAEPIIPLSLFRNRIVAVAAVTLGITSMGLFGTLLYIPLFVQGVVGTGATASGTVLTPMMITMILSSIVAGHVISRTGRYRIVGFVGLATTTLGMALLSQMGPDTDYGTVVRNMMLVGLGLGPTMPVFTLAAQNAVPFSQLGVVTSLTQFFRSIGGTVGAAVFGSLLVNRFSPALHAGLPPQVAAAIPAEQLARLDNPQALLNPETAQSLQQGLAGEGGALFGPLMESIRVALAVALDEVFLASALVLAAGAVLVLFLQEVPLRKSYGPPSSSLEHGAALDHQEEADQGSAAPPRHRPEPALEGSGAPA